MDLETEAPLPEGESGDSTYSLSWEPPSRRPKPRRRWVVPVAIAVVAALVVAGLATSGELPGFSTSPHKGPTGPSLTYGQAEPIASRAASLYSGTNQLSVAVGIVSPVAYTAPITNLTGSSCAPSGSLATEVTIPAFEGNYTRGESPAWFFLFWRASPPNISLVAVINGTAEYFGSIPAFPACGASVVSTIRVQGSVVDSPQAASAITPYADPFLSAHGSALAMYVLIGGFYGTYFSFGSVWNIGYSTCSLGVASAGSGFNASVNASSATVLSHVPVRGVSCAASPSILMNAGITPYVVPAVESGIPALRFV